MCVIESQSRVLNLQTNGNSKNKRHRRAQSTDVHSLATDKIFCIHKHLVFRDIALLIYLLSQQFLVFYNRSSLFKKNTGFKFKYTAFSKRLVHSKFLHGCSNQSLSLLQDQLFMCWPQFALRECGSSADLRPVPAGTNPWPDSGRQPGGAYTREHRYAKQFNNVTLNHAKNRASSCLKIILHK